VRESERGETRISSCFSNVTAQCNLVGNDNQQQKQQEQKQ